MLIQTPQCGRQTGFSMVEVLVTIVILAVGLLGVAGIQALGLRTATVALEHNTVTLLATEMAERVRVNRLAFENGHYNIAVDANTPPAGQRCETTCTPEQQAVTDLLNWYDRLMQLNAASAVIRRDPTDNSVTILINWTDLGLGFDNQSGEETQTFTHYARMS